MQWENIDFRTIFNLKQYVPDCQIRRCKSIISIMIVSINSTVCVASFIR